MKMKSTLGIVLMLMGAVTANATHWELLQTGGFARVEMLLPPFPPVEEQLAVDSNNSFAPWTYSDSASASHNFNSPSGPTFAVHLWADAEMFLSAEDCDLETLISVSAGLGILDQTDPNNDPKATPLTADFLVQHNYSVFGGKVKAEAEFLARVYEPCGVDVPCGIFEVDMTGQGDFEPFCGPLLPGNWTVRLAADAASVEMDFFWDRTTLTVNGIPVSTAETQTKTVDTQITFVPEPSAGCLVLLGIGGFFAGRRR